LKSNQYVTTVVPHLLIIRSIPADLIFNPSALYDHLADSDGGISEWIIPLVFQRLVTDVWWLRPHWARTIDDGHHLVHVGAIVPTPSELEDEDIGRAFEALEPAILPFMGPVELEHVLSGCRLRVSTDLSYWIEDAWCVAPLERLNPCYPLRLSVGTVGPYANSSSASAAWHKPDGKSCQDWILDICKNSF
jgi:hypothetical protein